MRTEIGTSTVTPATNVGSDFAAPAIADYGVVGDGRSLALISREGSLDWLCWPRFDSPAIFCRLLDPTRGGFWRVSPSGVSEISRRYFPATNVLETRFQTENGVLLLTDFMPLADAKFVDAHLVPDYEVIRIAKCESGKIELQVEFAPTPDFARRTISIKDRGRLGLRVETGNGLLALYTALNFSIVNATATAGASMAAGDQQVFRLAFSQEAPTVLSDLTTANAALKRTLDWWQAWSKSFSYDGPYADEVLRSALTLKLLGFALSGAFVAAGTTSLPEKVGGKLNWDYRYCWLRDASVIMDALCGTGFYAEAEGFSEWLLHATRLSQPKLNVVYNVYGNSTPREKALAHFSGYRQSQPVNLGNDARTQFQLDTHGEVISAAAKIIEHQRGADRETAKVLMRFGKYVSTHWQEVDAGIWEERGEGKLHTHSRLLCWVALDALIHLDESGVLPCESTEEFRQTREKIRRTIETDCWSEKMNSYVSEPHGDKLDATLLQIALYGFDDPAGQRMQQTYQRVCQILGAGDGLVYRNLDQGEPIEGAFGICGFWAVEFLAMGGGTLDEARRAFERLLKYGNDLGLHAEEVDPETGAALGNFPQAFTHAGLINAALAIDKRIKGEAGDASQGKPNS